MGELIQYEQRRWEQWKRLALDSVTSPHSRGPTKRHSIILPLGIALSFALPS